MKPLAALPLLLAAGFLAGCPDTSVNLAGSGGDAGSGGGPAGEVKVVQMLGKGDDPALDGLVDCVESPDGKKVYATSWAGQLYSFDRSPVDGSLARAYSSPVYNAFGIAITPDGAHLYATGSFNPNETAQFDVDPVTGEPVPKATLMEPTGGEVAVAAGGTLLFKSEAGLPSSYIQAYRIDPSLGALTAGEKTPHDSPQSNFVFFADDEHGTLYAERTTGDGQPKYVVRYAVDPASGALTKEAEISADLWWGYVQLARCQGTTRLYVAQEAGNIGYADIGGASLSISSTFTHPDLVHARSATLSPDCRNLYVVTQQDYAGSLVVLARDAAGDLTWLQTILMGANTAIPSITAPMYPVVSRDGENVYVDSFAPGEGFVVFRRDTTGEGFR